MHTKPVSLIKYNAAFEAVISVDKQGILNYWTGAKHEYSFPKNVNFDSKLDTDLFEFVKQKTYAVSLCFSPNGEIFATYGADRKVSIDVNILSILLTHNGSYLNLGQVI